MGHPIISVTKRLCFSTKAAAMGSGLNSDAGTSAPVHRISRILSDETGKYGSDIVSSEGGVVVETLKFKRLQHHHLHTWEGVFESF